MIRQATAHNTPMISCWVEPTIKGIDPPDLGAGGDESGPPDGAADGIDPDPDPAGIVVEGRVEAGEGIFEGEGVAGVFGNLGTVRKAVLFPVLVRFPITTEDEFVPDTVVPLMRVAFLVALRMSEFSVVSLRRPLAAGPWDPATRVPPWVPLLMSVTSLDVPLAVAVLLLVEILSDVVFPIFVVELVVLTKLLNEVILVPLTDLRMLVMLAVVFAVAFPDTRSMMHCGTLFSAFKGFEGASN